MKRSCQKCLAVLTIVTGFALGCASHPVRTDNMVVQGPAPTPDVPTAPLSQVLRVGSVSGGMSSGPAGSRVGNADLKVAVEKSLAAAGLAATMPADAQYVLSAEIVQMDTPFMALTMDINMTVEYKLKDVTTGQVVWQEAMSSSCTKRVSDKFSGAARLRLANECAAQANIAQLLETLRVLKLDK